MSTISSRSLIQLCHRVGTAVHSGVDARQVWEMEERHASGPLREALGAIRQQVDAGATVAEGMQASNGYFPPMFVAMVAVGEQTGKLDEVLRRLAEHYEQLARMRRMFWFGIAWPLFELTVAVLVIGLVIYITGVIAAIQGGEAQDLLGLCLQVAKADRGTHGEVIGRLDFQKIHGSLTAHPRQVAVVHGGSRTTREPDDGDALAPFQVWHHPLS
jgi:hypothetical protein